MTMIAAAAAFGLLGMQAAHADAVQRYESGAMIQHMSSPQKAEPYAQAEGTRGGNSMYGRQAAAEQTGVDNGALRQAAAEQTGVDNGALHQAAAEQTGVDNGAYHQAAAEQTGVDNGIYHLAAAEQTGVDNGRI
ncbi:MAG: hypothetical protein J0H14_23250 [Alphaproteobacteria bacterium]|nr:hypothetical protein [Alphaproteobacteria bacterium]